MNFAHRSDEDPPSWPASVETPHNAGWELSAIRWLWELLPAHFRNHWILVTHPLLLARQAQRQVQGEIYILRRRPTYRAELEALYIAPDVIEQTIRLHAEEWRRLVEVEREIRSVIEALHRLFRRSGAS